MRLKAVFLSLLLVSPPASLAAYAGDECHSVVQGLSNNYNPNTGSGFLAVRKRPSASSRMIDRLFNGDRVEIVDRSSNWYLVITEDGVQGWASARWIRNSCDN